MTLSNGLQGFWKCNDNAADIVVLDSSGNGHNGEASANTEDLNTTGKIGDGFLLEGNYFTAGDISNMDLAPNQDISIAIWAKWTVSTDPNQTLYHKYHVGNEKGMYIMAVRLPPPDVGKIVMRSRVRFNPDGEYKDVSTAMFTPSDWFLIIVNIDRDGNISIYLNNESHQSFSISEWNDVDASNDQPVGVGENANDGEQFGPWDGSIDCIAVWNRTLNATERTELWNGGDGIEDFGGNLVVLTGQHIPENWGW